MIRKLLGCGLIMLMAGCASVTSAERPAATATAATATAATDAFCPVTPPTYDQPPKDPNADPFGYGPWQISTDRALWVGLPPEEIWHTGGEKVVWIRPAGTDLTISGERIDQDGPPLEAYIPCCYPTGFQTSELTFPEPGCWRIAAQAGEHQLTFVTRVEAQEKK
ncbi:MAG: hypothetical protein H6659_10645 [Ardenticatenaceae bacterium]|nr:hypothetical protein [Ardenticatenaceae bacterium]